MERICLTEDIPEREARSYETANGDNIFITQRDGCFMLTRIFVRICKPSLNF